MARNYMTKEQIKERNKKISKGMERIHNRRSAEYEEKISNKKSVAFWNGTNPKKKITDKKRKEFLKKYLTKIVPREKACGVVVVDQMDYMD